MAINLKPVDVAVIGLGAAGGVAVLPLARAGLKVAGIEAGTWMDPHSFKPDEMHNNVRALLTSRAEGESGNPHLAHRSRSARARAQHASHDERHRRHFDPLLGAELAATGVGFQDAHGIGAAIRRRRDSEGLDAGGLADDYDELEHYYDTVEHEVGVSGKAGNIAGQDRSARQHVRSAAAARVSRCLRCATPDSRT